MKKAQTRNSSLRLELVALVFEKNIKRGHQAVAPGNLLLHLNLFSTHHSIV